MGKKNKHRRRNRDRGGDAMAMDDDNDSVMSASTMGESMKDVNRAASEATARDEFIDALELLTEKRTSVREAALGTLLGVLGRYPMAETVLGRAETLREHLAQCVRRGGPKEAQRAGRLLCVCLPVEPVPAGGA